MSATGVRVASPSTSARPADGSMRRPGRRRTRSSSARCTASPTSRSRCPTACTGTSLRLYRRDPRRAAPRPRGAGDELSQHRHRLVGRRLRAARRRRRARSASRIHYRDARTDAGGRAGPRAGPRRRRCTRATGLQFLPFNTLYQLAAARARAALGARADDAADARPARLLADRRASSPSGPTPRPPGCSTPRSRDVGTDLVETLGLDRRAAAAARRARRRRLGPLRDDVARDDRLPRRHVGDAVGSHDTASAVVGVPAEGPPFAYISCGHLVAGRRRAGRARS